MRYNVSVIPQTIINDGAGVVLGAMPEEYFLRELKRAEEFKLFRLLIWIYKLRSIR